ncbi:MAG: ABC transporter transmembrane domain-containing protein [Rhodospirillales bacterium]
MRLWRSGAARCCCAGGRHRAAQAAPFGLMWFAAEIARQGGILRDVSIAAVASSLIGLATPLLYHVIIDRVIPYHAEQTLLTVLVVFGVVTAFDAVFTYARQRLMLFLTNKVDARLAARTFEILLSLPMPFFERQPAGVLVRHMQQTEKLRHFLTGRLFQCVLDCALMPGAAGADVRLQPETDRPGPRIRHVHRRHHSATDPAFPGAPERAVSGRGRPPGLSGGNAARHTHDQIPGDGTGAPGRVEQPRRGGDYAPVGGWGASQRSPTPQPRCSIASCRSACWESARTRCSPAA